MPDNTSLPSISATPALSTRDGAQPKCHVIRDTGTEAATGECHPLGDIDTKAPATVLELRVRNHPGTMSHVTGLFARRAFNLEAIVCVPVGDGAESCMLLLVANGPSLEQVGKQLLKLYDVLTVRRRPDLGPDFFSRFSQAALAGSPPPGT
jgi:acetolactate synthase-1/3 small subunit